MSQYTINNTKTFLVNPVIEKDKFVVIDAKRKRRKSLINNKIVASTFIENVSERNDVIK